MYGHYALEVYSPSTPAWSPRLVGYMNANGISVAMGTNPLSSEVPEECDFASDSFEGLSSYEVAALRAEMANCMPINQVFSLETLVNPIDLANGFYAIDRTFDGFERPIIKLNSSGGIDTYFQLTLNIVGEGIWVDSNGSAYDDAANETQIQSVAYDISDFLGGYMGVINDDGNLQQSTPDDYTVLYI